MKLQQGVSLDKSLIENKFSIACVTGHRIIKGSELEQLSKKIDEIITALISQDILTFLVGGAIGFDATASKAVLKARELNSNVKLIMVLPCYNQEARWNKKDKQTYRHLLENADGIVYVSEQTYFDGCMKLNILTA